MIQELKPNTLEQVSVRDQRMYDLVISGMVNVVHGKRGTARRSGLGAEYKFAGKTGTAQVIGIKQGASYNEKNVAKKFRDHALFISFAPVDDPKIAVAVIAENGGGGSRTAAPIARKVMDFYLIGRRHPRLRKISRRKTMLRKFVRHLDPPLLLSFFVLSGLSLVVLYSSGGEDVDLLIKQGVRILIGFVILFTVAQLPPQTLQRWAPLHIFHWFGPAEPGSAVRNSRKRRAAVVESWFVPFSTRRDYETGRTHDGGVVADAKSIAIAAARIGHGGHHCSGPDGAGDSATGSGYGASDRGCGDPGDLPGRNRVAVDPGPDCGAGGRRATDVDVAARLPAPANFDLVRPLV